MKELEAKLGMREAEFQTQLARELNPLKEQLQIHTQTTGILIAEKAELTAALSQAQQSVRKSSGLFQYLITVDTLIFVYYIDLCILNE